MTLCFHYWNNEKDYKMPLREKSNTECDKKSADSKIWCKNKQNRNVIKGKHGKTTKDVKGLR